MELIVPKVRGQFDQNQIFPMDIEVYKPYRSVNQFLFSFMAQTKVITWAIIPARQSSRSNEP